jgi:transposase
LPVDGARVDVIQPPKLEPRIMRYELSDYEWTAIKPMLSNSRAAFGVQMTVACSMASFGSYVQVRHGATCQRAMGHIIAKTLSALARIRTARAT